MRKAFLLIIGGMAWLTANAQQLELRTEVQATASAGDHTPLWLNANKYGLSSLDKTNGYVRAGAFRSIDNDSSRRWAWGAGVDMAVASGFTSTFVVQQAYGELRWLKGLITMGSKEQTMELKNQELSSGSQTLGINARPVPGIRLSLPDYWDIPYTGGWLALKGHLFYGMQTDDGWQRDFTQRQSKYAEHTKVHTKAGYLRIGQAERPLNVELGLEMACQYGGTAYPMGMYDSAVENEDGIKGMVKALIPSGGEAIENVYRNASGNHLGSLLARVNLDYERWGVSAYADHFFEDHSGLFLMGNSGYGVGDEWTTRKGSDFFLYDLKDMMLGAEVRLKQTPWLNTIVLEYVYSKYQSGPVYHDHTQRMADNICGRDNYYNHYIFSGWQHWGQVMGNPLYLSPLYNDDTFIRVENNRFWAWHLGLSGSPMPCLHYRALCTVQKGWGTYDIPYDKPRRNVSLLAEMDYSFPVSSSSFAGFHVRGAVGMDAGKLLGNNYGVQFTIGKTFNIGSK